MSSASFGRLACWNPGTIEIARRLPKARVCNYSEDSILLQVDRHSLWDSIHNDGLLVPPAGCRSAVGLTGIWDREAASNVPFTHAQLRRYPYSRQCARRGGVYLVPLEAELTGDLWDGPHRLVPALCVKPGPQNLESRSAVAPSGTDRIPNLLSEAGDLVGPDIDTFMIRTLVICNFSRKTILVTRQSEGDDNSPVATFVLGWTVAPGACVNAMAPAGLNTRD